MSAITLREYYPGNFSYYIINSNSWLGQQFTIGNVTEYPNERFCITQLKVYLSNPNEEEGYITAEIRTIDGNGYPTTNVLSTGSIHTSLLSTEVLPEEVTINMSPYDLEPSTTYVFILYPDENILNTIDIGLDDLLALYQGGDGVVSEDQGEIWYTSTEYEYPFNLAFETWGYVKENVITSDGSNFVLYS